MKFKNKSKSMEVATPPPPPKVLTLEMLEENLNALTKQKEELTNSVLMVQGAIQVIEMQIKDVNSPPVSEDKTKNGVN